MYDDAGADFAPIVGATIGGSGSATSFMPAGSTGPVFAGPFGPVTAPVIGNTHRVFASLGASGTPLLLDQSDPVCAIFNIGLGKAFVANDAEWASAANISDCVTGSLPALNNERLFLNSLAAVAPATPIAFTFNACAVDINCDAIADIFDYLDFVEIFAAQSTGSDFNGDATVDIFDYLDFVAALNAGC